MRAILAVVTALCALSATPVHAAKGDKWLGVLAGVTIPVDDFAEVAGPGFQGGLTGAYSVDDFGDISVTVTYHDWGERTDPFLARFLGTDAHLKYTALMASLHITRYSPAFKGVSVYGRGGFGATAAYLQIGRPTGRFLIDSEEWGYNVDFGGGVSIAMTPRRRLDIGALYHIVQASGSAANVVSVGMSLKWAMGKGERIDR